MLLSPCPHAACSCVKLPSNKTYGKHTTDNNNTLQLASVGLAQACHNKITLLLGLVSDDASGGESTWEGKGRVVFCIVKFLITASHLYPSYASSDVQKKVSADIGL